MSKLFISLLVSVSIFGVLTSIVDAGKIRLEPAAGEFIAECPFEVDVMVDMEGVESNTVGISFFIDDTIFALSDLVTEGAMFPAYTSFVRGKAWHGENKGKETISFMGTTAKKSGVKGKGKLATVKITSLLGVKAMDFEFYAIPGFSADDSNINYLLDKQVEDALVEAIGGRYTFVKGECPNYETPVIIAEEDDVILKTHNSETFEIPTDGAFTKIARIFVGNVKFIIIGLLVLIIFFVLFKKKREEKDEDKKDTIK